MLDSGYEEETR